MTSGPRPNLEKKQIYFAGIKKMDQRKDTKRWVMCPVEEFSEMNVFSDILDKANYICHCQKRGICNN